MRSREQQRWYIRELHLMVVVLHSASLELGNSLVVQFTYRKLLHSATCSIPCFIYPFSSHLVVDAASWSRWQCYLGSVMYVLHWGISYKALWWARLHRGLPPLGAVLIPKFLMWARLHRGLLSVPSMVIASSPACVGTSSYYVHGSPTSLASLHVVPGASTAHHLCPAW